MSDITYGFDRFQKQLLDLAEREAPDMIDQQVARMQTMVLADVKQLTPVKSGNLKRRWTISKVENGKGEVGTNVDYAPHVEKGFEHKNGYKVPGYHMLEQAVENMNRRLPGEMDRFFNQLMGEFKL